MTYRFWCGLLMGQVLGFVLGWLLMRAVLLPYDWEAPDHGRPTSTTPTKE
jgi:hypothetical protein